MSSCWVVAVDVAVTDGELRYVDWAGLHENKELEVKEEGGKELRFVWVSLGLEAEVGR